LADPLAALAGMQERLAYYAANVAEYHAKFLDVSVRLSAERERAAQIGREQGNDAQQAYDRERVRPLVIENSVLVLNFRYFGLAALSMRRFVGGRMYLLLKVRNAASPQDAAWMMFLERYASFVADFETTVMPVLVDADF